MNPFLYQNFCYGEYFCFRNDELQKMENLILTSSNVFLYSKRRYGKTSLIKEFFSSKIDKTSFIPIYIDLFDITNPSHFAKALYKEIACSLPFDYKEVLKKLQEYFMMASFSVTMGDNNELKFTPALRTYNFGELMADIYKGLDKLSSQTDKKIVIAFDEFQQITLIKEYKIDTILKKYMDSYPNIQYIFTGLKRHLLTEFFEKNKSPLYDMVSFMELKPIPMDEFYSFVNKKFDGKLSYDIFKEIYLRTEGESKLIQEFCYHLHYLDSDKGGEEINREDLDYVCTLMLESKNSYFKMVLDRMSLPLKIALKAIIISGGTEFYKKDILLKLQTTKSSLSTAIRHLYKDEIIDKESNSYYITNKCFEIWCKKKYSLI